MNQRKTVKSIQFSASCSYACNNALLLAVKDMTSGAPHMTGNLTAMYNTTDVNILNMSSLSCPTGKVCSLDSCLDFSRLGQIVSCGTEKSLPAQQSHHTCPMVAKYARSPVRHISAGRVIAT